MFNNYILKCYSQAQTSIFLQTVPPTTVLMFLFYSGERYPRKRFVGCVIEHYFKICHKIMWIAQAKLLISIIKIVAKCS